MSLGDLLSHSIWRIHSSWMISFALITWGAAMPRGSNALLVARNIPRLVFGNSLFSGSRLRRSYSVHHLRIFPEATHCDLSQKMGSLYAFLCCFKCTLGGIHQSLGFLSNFWPDLWLHQSIQIEITSNGIDGILSEFPLLVTSSSL